MSSSIGMAGGTYGPLSTGAGSEPASKKSEVSKEAFMTLLVAQIKNQDPMSPADGAQFITQLAQFSELEQMMAMRGELVAIREELAEPAAQASKTRLGDSTSV